MTKQIFSTLKKEYSKSNTLRREYILKKYGFNDEASYLGFLTYQLKKIELKESIKELTEKKSQNNTK